MDFHAAMETFAEAWVAANTHTVVNPEGQAVKQSHGSDDLPTQLSPDQIQSIKATPTKQGPPGPTQLSPSSSGSTKSLPIHCIIEQTSGQPSFETSSGETSTHNSIELDSYAILPGTTLLSECVRAALVKLGYSAAEAMGAKGAIQIKNWKPLHFDAITDEKAATIDDILGELTQVATLRIRICSEEDQDVPTEWTDHTVRCAVQVLLKEMNQSTLAKLSPLSQSAISNIANWKYINTLSTEKCREFGKWYRDYRKTTGQAFTEEQPKDSRLTFHPELEVPQMRQWYKRYKNPSETKLNFFMSELNKSHVRQERQKVTIEKLKNWWKNERQREKRISMKEDSKEQEKKEIEKLKVESTRIMTRRKFVDHDKETLKVAKVVPSPQQSSETRPRSQPGQGQIDPSLVICVQQPLFSQQDPVSSQRQMILPPSDRQTVHSLPHSNISEVHSPYSTPRGFVSLLQQSPGPELVISSPGSRIDAANQSSGLARNSPGSRIGHSGVQIWSGADGSEIRSCDFRPGPTGQGRLMADTSGGESLSPAGEKTAVVSDPGMEIGGDRHFVQSHTSPTSGYGNWNYESP